MDFSSMTLEQFFWTMLLIFLSPFILVVIVGLFLGFVMSDKPSIQTPQEHNNPSAQENKLKEQPIKKSKPLWGKKKPSFGSWAWVVQQQKKEDAYQRKWAQQAEANRIAQEQMRRMINGGGY